MNRREVLRWMGLSSLGWVGSGLLFNQCSQSKSPVKNWAWMHARRYASVDDWKHMFANMKRHGFDAALVLADKNILKTILPLGKEADIEIHNWIITLQCRKEEIHEAHPEWFTVSRLGESSLSKPPYVPYYKWLCPSRVEVQEYVKNVVSDLADLDGLQGIHLDYIRHSDVILPIGIQPKYDLVQDREYPEFDFCYCSVCRDLFKKQEGIDPLKIQDPAGHEAWLQFRYDGVTRLVNQLSAVAHKKNKMLTAAVFPSPDIARKLVRQDWPHWRVDAVLPMMYHKYYNEDVAWIKKVTLEGTQALSPQTSLYSGLHVSMLTPDELFRARAFALEGGAQGIVLFTAEAMSEAHWKQIETF